MRTHAVLAALSFLAAGFATPTTSLAQDVPSAEQIIKSLTPTSTSGPTRGIRLNPNPTSAPAQAQAPAPTPAAPASVNLMVQFASGSAELTPTAVRILDNLGKALSDQTLTSYRFRIEGHTDTVGTPTYNKDLSDRRAAAVVDYLANNFHVDRHRLQAIGMGEDGLLVPTPDQTPEARNRRVQVVNLGS
jgi:outer membrane protein OmpA-like peptidoglycan-associated protein